jgi:hypothetical protein
VAGVILKLTRLLHWRVKARALLTIPAFLTRLIGTQTHRKLRQWMKRSSGPTVRNDPYAATP